MFVVGSTGWLNAAFILIAATLIAGLVRFLPSFLKNKQRNRLAANFDERIESQNGQVVLRFIWASLIALFGAHLIIHGLLKHPQEFDTLVYHLPFIDFWIQEGTLASQSSARWSTPANSELLGLWFSVPFSGDFLVSLNNLPVLIVFVASVLELARNFGLIGWWSFAAVVGSLAVRPLLNEIYDTRNDLMVGAFFLGGIVYLLRFHGSGRSSEAFLFGMCMGLLTGTKYFAVGYSCVLAIMFVLAGIARQGFGRTLFALPIVAVFGMMTGGYWFFRNWFMTGYSLYPQGSPDMSERILHPNLSQTTLAFNGSDQLFDLFLEAVWKQAGPWQLIALATVPTFLIIGLFRLFDRNLRSNHSDQRWIITGCCLIGSIGVLMITPMLVEDQPDSLNQLRWGATPIRYGLCSVSLSSLAMLAVIYDFSRGLSNRSKNAIAFGLILLSVAQFIGQFWHLHRSDLAGLFFASLACLILVGVWKILNKWNRHRYKTFLRLQGFMVAATTVMTIVFLSVRWHRDFAQTIQPILFDANVHRYRTRAGNKNRRFG